MHPYPHRATCSRPPHPGRVGYESLRSRSNSIAQPALAQIGQLDKALAAAEQLGWAAWNQGLATFLTVVLVAALLVAVGYLVGWVMPRRDREALEREQAIRAEARADRQSFLDTIEAHGHLLTEITNTQKGCQEAIRALTVEVRALADQFHGGYRG